ncbi:DUF1257 domain-containing protein [Paenibacillus xylanilyticus]|uniref:DUF1257 domain-containing protein n=1 Tax=Paenibacillus xylanilyticus TaxID=248903 RepID=A0A7Y6BVH8_9BACL|nr:DUF1257 domain-containing protein [Paenibacillus xylanilyticus]NUU75765.1 DUF1257 domain-containing protein [Paenibacillus xylanilyticus]
MSHTSRIETIITNIPALERAVKELKLTFVKGGIVRAYSKAQEFHADYVIQLKGPYDVGVIKVEKKYELRTDWWGGHVEKEIGKNAGRLLQEYQIAVAVMVAQSQGHTIIKQKLPNGAIKMRIQQS